MLKGKMPHLSIFSAAGIVTCNFRCQQRSLKNQECTVSLEYKEIRIILTIERRYHPLNTNTCTTGIGREVFGQSSKMRRVKISLF